MQLVLKKVFGNRRCERTFAQDNFKAVQDWLRLIVRLVSWTQSVTRIKPEMSRCQGFSLLIALAEFGPA